jgi:2,4-dienoyl-CoA reductase-like NADH-dependent reductase (Old Yellow Enzyme family)/thioredoxin reductase
VTDTARLFEPFEIGPVRLRNRVFVPAHTTNFAEHNLPTDVYAAYLRERARGGPGLIITEGIRVHPTSLRRFGLAGYSDAVIAPFAKIIEAVHAEGARIFAQIVHSGRHTGDEWMGLWGPSPVPWAVGAEIPHELTLAEIRTVVASSAGTARRMVDAGFDGLEVHVGHGHLLQQFLSPATNLRTDAYGGPLENRLRLAREVLEAVIAAAPGDVPVGIRISADEFLPGGLTVDTMIPIVGTLLEAFPLRFVHVSHSAYVGAYSLATQMADMSFGTAPFRAFPRAFKHAFPRTPVLAVCRLDDLPTAASILADGEADLVGLARAHIADPYIVSKTQTGRAHAIRSCIACNQGCIGRVELTLPIRCVVNPEVGMESAWAAVPRPASPRRVLVAGGGPAGLEAALTAHRRGHAVTLCEAREHLGGQVRHASALVGRDRFALLVRELERDVRHAGVPTRLTTPVLAEDLIAGAWDAVVIATGSRPAPTAVPGAAHVWSTWDAIEDPERLGHHVLILDEDGGPAGAGLAEHLARQGRRVELVSPTAAVAWRVTTYSKLALIKRLGELKVKVRPLRRLVRVQDRLVAVLADVITGEEEHIADVSAIVHAAPPAANDGLLRDLERLRFPGEVHVVGDAYAPRTCLEAVYEGRAVATAIGLSAFEDAASLHVRAPYRFATAQDAARR